MEAAVGERPLLNAHFHQRGKSELASCLWSFGKQFPLAAEQGARVEFHALGAATGLRRRPLGRAGRRLPAAGAGRSHVAVERSKEGRVGLRGSAGEVWNLN